MKKISQNQVIVLNYLKPKQEIVGVYKIGQCAVKSLTSFS